jgi:hypothetical protein
MFIGIRRHIDVFDNARNVTRFTHRSHKRGISIRIGSTQSMMNMDHRQLQMKGGGDVV